MKSVYSKLVYIEHVPEESFYTSLVDDWIRGTKVYFYTPSEQVISTMKNILEVKIRELGLEENKSFFEGNRISKILFNFSVGRTKKYLGKDFCIVNGHEYKKYIKILEQVDMQTSFNLNQYEVEHAEIGDIILKAGAGTGKTYSMISRINYLIWRMEYTPEQLKEAIIMVTFTNEAADSMKHKLKKCFLDYYVLTKDIRYFEYIDSINDMNVSTIDSLAKKILKKYSYALGLGVDFKITTDYYRRRLLHHKLSEFIKKEDNAQKLMQVFETPLYEIEGRLSRLLEIMGNKKVDLSDPDISYYDFKEKGDFVVSLVTEVVKETQEVFDQWSTDNNVVALSDLVKKVSALIRNHQLDLMQDTETIQFVFVDEFQDTDDVQIELLCAFKEVFKFNLFVVGDIKQCIYRFRGAEEDAFDKLIKNITQPQVLWLTKNYRTDEKILNRYDEIFNIWGNRGYLIYNQDSQSKDTIIGTKKLNKNLEIWGHRYNLPHTWDWKERKQQKDLALKELLPNLIREAVVDIENQQKGKGTVALLVRYNRQVKEVKDICERAGLLIETPIGGELFKLEPTIELYKLVLALKNSTDVQCLYNLYSTSYTNQHWNKDDLYSQRKTQEEVFEAFYDNPPLPKWSQYLKDMRCMPILRVIRDIIEDTKPWNQYALRKMEEVECSFEDYTQECEYFESFYKSNLEKLLETIVQNGKVEYQTINHIAKYLEIMITTNQEKEARIQVKQDCKVRVLCTTVHRAKGLEYDTVILPFGNSDICASVNTGDADIIYKDGQIGYRIKKGRKDDYQAGHIQNNYYKKFRGDEKTDRTNEEARILYVALTRVIRRLIYIYDEPQNNYKKQGKVEWKNMIKGEI